MRAWYWLSLLIPALFIVTVLYTSVQIFQINVVLGMLTTSIFAVGMIDWLKQEMRKEAFEEQKWREFVVWFGKESGVRFRYDSWRARDAFLRSSWGRWIRGGGKQVLKAIDLSDDEEFHDRVESLEYEHELKKLIAEMNREKWEQACAYLQDKGGLYGPRRNGFADR